MEMVATTLTDLENGLSHDQIIAAVEDKIKEALTIADEALWRIMTGVDPLCDGMSKIISKANRRLPKTVKPAGFTPHTLADKSEMAREMGYALSLLPPGTSVAECEDTPRPPRAIRACRLVDPTPETHHGVVDCAATTRTRSSPRIRVVAETPT